MRREARVKTRDLLKRAGIVISWALYDLANQFFAVNVVSLYFVRWLTLERNYPEIFYSFTFGISLFLVAILSPFLGAISDKAKKHRFFLAGFTFLSIIFTASLSFTNNVFLALFFFGLANLGCQEAVVFYNALMVKVAPQGKQGLISGLGRMFGYGGAILALLLTKPVVLHKGYQATFLLTAILFFIFSLPCILFIKEKLSGKAALSFFFRKKELADISRNFKRTVFESSKFKGLGDFLKASFFGFCVVNIIILFMSVYATKVFGLNDSQVINLIAFSTLFALGGSILSGSLSDYLGYKYSMIGVFFLWGITLLGASLLTSPYYWLIGALAGFSLGSTWTVSRALVVNIVPEEKIGEVFGLFNLVGYLSGIIGPLFWGIIVLFFSDWGEWGYRVASLSLILFITLAIIYLCRLPQQSLKW